MNIKAELAAMERLMTGDLVERYAALTGHPVRTRHRAYLIRKIAWRLQADAEGDLSERARRRAAELADELGRNARDRAQLYHPQRVADQTVAVYECVLQNDRAEKH